MSVVRVHFRDTKHRHIDLRLGRYDIVNLGEDLHGAGGIAGYQAGPSEGPYTFIPREAIAYVEIDP